MSPVSIVEAPIAEAAYAPVFAAKEEPPAEAFNCYLYVKNRVEGLPRMAAIAPGSPPDVGNVAIFNYHGVKHIAIVQSITEAGFWVKESNYKRGVIGTRFIEWNYYALVGFYDPKGSSYPGG